MVSSKAYIAVVVGASLALAGCSSSTPVAEEDGVFSVYVDVSLTGPLGGQSQAVLEGLTVAADSINSEGGIAGQQVELTVVDDQLDPTIAVSLLQEQLDTAKPDLVFHGVSSAITLAMLPLLTRNEVLSIGTPYANEINDPESFPYAFGTNPPLRFAPEDAVATFEADGVQKVALLYSNDALGSSIAEEYVQVFAEAGVELVTETYTSTDIDMTAQLQRLQTQNPEALILQGFGPAVGYMLATRANLGWDIPTIGDAGVGNGTNLGLVSDPSHWNNFRLKAWASNTSDYVTHNPEAQEALLAGLQREGAKLDQIMGFYNFAWDALQVVKQGVEQAGTKSAPEVAKALEDLEPLDGAGPFLGFATFRFSPENHFRILGEQDAGLVEVNPGPIENGLIQSID